MPARPKRMTPGAAADGLELTFKPTSEAEAEGAGLKTGVNVSRDSLMSGPSTVMPMASASAMKWETFSALPSSAVSTAAMNCTG